MQYFGSIIFIPTNFSIMCNNIEINTDNVLESTEEITVTISSEDSNIYIPLSNASIFISDSTGKILLGNNI